MLNEEMNCDLSKLALSSPLPATMFEERPITVDEACSLRLLLFGNTGDTFGSGWTNQGFKFRNLPMSYGIIQNKAGPCGVLAAIQAHVIFELLFGYTRSALNCGRLRPNRGDTKEALARALASILWQAGENKKAMVAVRKKGKVLNNSFINTVLTDDGIIEYLHLRVFRSNECLLDFVFNIISELMNDKNAGCITFLYSVILTHGIDKIKEEMDYPDSHLIGEDGYCSQEIINLILIGKAVPNIFDGNVELNSGGEEKSIHHGVSSRSKIGLLSLYEYQGTITVGDFFKTPHYPIWLISGDCHFTVLFATTREILRSSTPKGSFTLFYHDGLAIANEETRLVIKPSAKMCPEPKDKSIPVVIRCIYTKWPLASVTEKSPE